MTKEEYIFLFEKYLSGKTTPKEEEQLFQNQDEFKFQEYTWDTESMGDRMLTKAEILRKSIPKPRRSNVYKRYYTYAAAAVILAILTAGLYLYQPFIKPDRTFAKTNISETQDDVLPGGNKAILTLADGSEIVLNDSSKGLIATQGNTTINKVNDGQLSYMAGNSGPSDRLLNTITIPWGGEYLIVLPDGTKVWLNSGSSLTFPTVFGASERVVKLTGEAYFEVVKNAHAPFSVKVNSTEVKVLGTHFNIMAYSDEKEVKATLFEGSIRLSQGSVDKTLKPGQEGSITNNGEIMVREADLEGALAWKNGYFYFDKADIGMIMRQLARWYNVQVVYEGQIPRNLFVGKISKKSKLSEVLDMLKFAKVQFEVKDQQITIME